MATIDSTQLTAVNDVLRGVGAAPVSSVSATGDAQIVAGLLDRVNEEVQTEDWFFNREYDVTLTPVAGQIAVPTDVIQIAVLDDCPAQIRNGFLYNLDLNSDSLWTVPIRVNLVRFLDLTALPAPARQYVVARARYLYAVSFLGNAQLNRELERQEGRARGNLMNDEARVLNSSQLKSWGAGRVIFRRGQPLLAV